MSEELENKFKEINKIVNELGSALHILMTMIEDIEEIAFRNEDSVKKILESYVEDDKSEFGIQLYNAIIDSYDISRKIADIEDCTNRIKQLMTDLVSSLYNLKELLKMQQKNK